MTLQRYHTITIIDTQYTFALRHEKHLTHTMFEARSHPVMHSKHCKCWVDTVVSSTLNPGCTDGMSPLELEEPGIKPETKISERIALELRLKHGSMIQYEDVWSVTFRHLRSFADTHGCKHNICQTWSNHGGLVWKQLQITSAYIYNSNKALKSTFHTTCTWHRRAGPDIQKMGDDVNEVGACRLPGQLSKN